MAIQETPNEEQPVSILSTAPAVEEEDTEEVEDESFNPTLSPDWVNPAVAIYQMCDELVTDEQRQLLYLQKSEALQGQIDGIFRTNAKRQRDEAKAEAKRLKAAQGVQAQQTALVTDIPL